MTKPNDFFSDDLSDLLGGGATPAPRAELRKVWPWGVARYERGYHKDGSERFAGYVWSKLPS